jgi:hypothetical protein
MAVVVGTILGIINHADMFISQIWERLRFIQLGITYLVPFCVSLFSSALADRHMELNLKNTVNILED